MGSEIPEDIHNKFWGVKEQHNRTEFENAAESFYAGPPRDAPIDRSAEFKAQAYNSFWGQDNQSGFDEGKTYSYEEARAIADSMK